MRRDRSDGRQGSCTLACAQTHEHHMLPPTLISHAVIQQNTGSGGED